MYHVQKPVQCVCAGMQEIGILKLKELERKRNFLQQQFEAKRRISLMPFYCSFYSIPRSMGIDCLLLQQNKKTWLLDCLSRHIYSIFVSNWPLVTTNHVTSFLSRSLLSDSILKCLHKENVCSLLYRISKKTSSLFVFTYANAKKDGVETDEIACD